MIFILCDEIDSGKSTFVLELAKTLIGQGKNISGWITPAHMDGGKKAGHDFIAIADSRISDRIPFTRSHPFENSFGWRRFHFNRAAFEIAEKLNADCDLFIMDEIGPLELDDRRGFHDVMSAVLSKSKNTLIVIRTGIEDAIRKFTGNRDVQTFDLKSARTAEFSV